MTSLAPQADQAVRHAVDAYIDGRLLPMFEGDAWFETRNSAYRLIDGVVHTAPDRALVGAELVGWLVDYVSRSEVTSEWRLGARAVLVDTRNDGVRGPHIVVTSATKSFRRERSLPPARAPFPSPASFTSTGSASYQGGSSVDQGWPLYTSPLPAPPPPPRMPSFGQALPPATVPPPQPSFARHPEIAPAQSARPSTIPPPPPRPLPRAMRPPPARAHQRGLPLR